MYYFLRQDLFKTHGVMEIEGHTDVTGSFDWITGVKFDRPVPRETLMLDPEYGTNLADYFDTTTPLMSPALIQALRGAGVTNFDAYPMLLKRMDTGEEIDNYCAVNFLGSIEAVDLQASQHRLRFGKPYFTGSITIDATKVHNTEAFRLSKGPGFVVLSERVAKAIEKKNFKAVLLQPTTDYSGT